MKIVLWRKLDHRGNPKYFIADVSFCCPAMSTRVLRMRQNPTHFNRPIHIHYNGRTKDIEVYVANRKFKEFLSDCPFCGKHIDIEIVVNHCP